MEFLPDPRNPRIITDEGKAKLAESMRLYGDLSGIVINRRTGMLVAGHQRIAVMSSERRVEPLGVLDEPDEHGTVEIGVIHDGENKFSYRVVDFDEATAKAAMLAANNHAGEWDELMAGGLLKEIAAESADLVNKVGFTQEEIDALLQDVNPMEGLEDGDGRKDVNVNRPGLAKHTVFSLGEFRFPVEREIYQQWKEELRQASGFNEVAILTAILERLKLPIENVKAKP